MQSIFSVQKFVFQGLLSLQVFATMLEGDEFASLGGMLEHLSVIDGTEDATELTSIPAIDIDHEDKMSI